MRNGDDWVTRFAADGLLHRENGRLRTTRRWQAAMARAALLLAKNDDGRDLRVPIAFALIDLYGDALVNEQLVQAIRTMLPIEYEELHPTDRMA
jgi:hypothetical protein